MSMVDSANTPSAPAWVSLEPFQELMCQWRSDHPYNAAHALLLRGRSNVDRLRVAIESVHVRTGLGELLLEPHRARMAWLPTTSPEPANPPRVSDPAAGINELLTGELERPFAGERWCPFRWTVQDVANGGSHFLALTYDHVVGDAFAAQALLAEVLHAYLAPHSCEPILRTRRAPAGTTVRRRCVNLPTVFRATVKTFLRYLRLRYAHRMHERRGGGAETAVVTRSLVLAGAHDRPPCKPDRMGAGWNDLFLAATALAIAGLTPARRTHRQRRALALGTIVSLRDKCRDVGTVDFSCRLAHHNVLVRRPDEEPDRVLRQVVDQTRRFKGRRAPCATIEPTLVRRLWPMLHITDARAGHRKLFPLCAGVSTVVVDPLWYGGAAEQVLRVVRSCPTGPAVPMVLAPTLFRDRIELSLTYRQSCLSPTQAGELLDSIARTLIQSEWVHPADQHVVSVVAPRIDAGPGGIPSPPEGSVGHLAAALASKHSGP